MYVRSKHEKLNHPECQKGAINFFSSDSWEPSQWMGSARIAHQRCLAAKWQVGRVHLWKAPSAAWDGCSEGQAAGSSLHMWS